MNIGIKSFIMLEKLVGILFFKYQILTPTVNIELITLAIATHIILKLIDRNNATIEKTHTAILFLSTRPE